MKTTRISIRRSQALLAILLAGALLALPACGKKEAAQAKGRKGAKAKAGEPLRIRIQTSENQDLATFVLRPTLVRVEYSEDGNPRLLEARRGGSVHRYWDGKLVLAEAARTGQQIRLRDSGGQPLWTIVLRGERVRLNPPEEGAEPFWLSRADDARLRVSRGEKTLGRVTLDGNKKRVKLRDGFGNVLFDAPSPKVEHWFGVLTLSDLPWMERYLLAMELLAAGG